MNVQKQIEEALAGLSLKEKSFVKGYVIGSINGKKPDPNVVAAQVTNGTVEQAKKKAEKWMQDTRILEAIEKYKNVSMKYESE